LSLVAFVVAVSSSTKCSPHRTYPLVWHNALPSFHSYIEARMRLSGFVGLVLVLTSIYLVMPPRGRITPRHALVGGIVVGVLWEGTRHVLVWYFATLSVVGVVYGSLATTIIGLLSLEIASIFLLLGAQTIAEYERLEVKDLTPPGELQTDKVRAEVK
jgi:uncharacterized BrkB/YihY/UPF0761 family membrane protein